MPHTAPDWSGAYLAGKTIHAGIVSSWYSMEMGAVAGEGYTDLIEYTVPADTVLYVCAGLISCDAPGIQKCAMNFSPALLGNVYYDTLFALPLNPNAAYEIEAGSELYVRVYNLDDIEHNFTVSLTGFEVSMA